MAATVFATISSKLPLGLLIKSPKLMKMEKMDYNFFISPWKVACSRFFEVSPYHFHIITKKRLDFVALFGVASFDLKFFRDCAKNKTPYGFCFFFNSEKWKNCLIVNAHAQLNTVSL